MKIGRGMVPGHEFVNARLRPPIDAISKDVDGRAKPHHDEKAKARPTPIHLFLSKRLVSKMP